MSVSVASVSGVRTSLVGRSGLGGGRFVQSRQVKSRQIEKPPQHGEKPYAQLVDEAFDGPVLRLSTRLRLLEEATTRKIRRGDAIDLIGATQRRREELFAVKRRNPLGIFATQYAAFAAGYVVLAIAWCMLFARH